MQDYGSSYQYFHRSEHIPAWGPMWLCLYSSTGVYTGKHPLQIKHRLSEVVTKVHKCTYWPVVDTSNPWGWSHWYYQLKCLTLHNNCRYRCVSARVNIPGSVFLRRFCLAAHQLSSLSPYSWCVRLTGSQTDRHRGEGRSYHTSPVRKGSTPWAAEWAARQTDTMVRPHVPRVGG